MVVMWCCEGERCGVCGGNWIYIVVVRAGVVLQQWWCCGGETAWCCRLCVMVMDGNELNGEVWI